MYHLLATNKRWRITKNGHIVLSGIGGVEQATSIARLHGMVLVKFKFLNHLKRVG